MNRKQIEKKLTEKHTLFADLVMDRYRGALMLGDFSIQAAITKDEVLNQTYIAGGCIASLLLGEPVKDYDIFMIGEGSLEETISDCFSSLENAKASANSISYTDKFGDLQQLIKTLRGTPENAVAEFDFVHCRNYFFKGKLVLDSGALESILTKDLKWTKRGGPGTLNRLIRFLNRGWTIAPKMALEMMQKLDVPAHVNGEQDGDY